MRIVMILLLPFLLVAGEAETELPASVERALNSFDTSVLRAQARYRGEVESAKKQLLRTLDREMEQATKKGDLDLALAIRTKKEALADYTAGGLAELDFLGNEMEDRFMIDRENMTARKWVALKGASFRMLATNGKENPISHVLPAGHYHIVAHPDDGWCGGGSKRGVNCSITGYPNRGTDWMKLFVKTEDSEEHCLEFTLAHSQNVSFYVFDPRPGDNVGSIRIKIVKLR